MPDPLPESRYRRLRELGAGGAGRVWLVEDSQRPGSRLALKELFAADEAKAEALRREFALVGSISHPGLVQVFDFGVDPKSRAPHFTLEYIDGHDIVQTVRQEGAPAFAPLAVECLRAVAFIHDLGYVHRDLKPANILVRSRPRGQSRATILDFGLAVSRGPSDQHERAGGTLPYMAPELLDGAGPDRRSDLYALGVVFHEAVYGRLPARFDNDNIADYFDAMRSGGKPDHPLPEGFSEGIRPWLTRLLDPDPDRRPATGGDSIGLLNELTGGSWELDLPSTRLARLRSGMPPGREEVLHRIWEALAGEGPRLVWLLGDAGVGKSRLLRWLGVEAIRKGWEVETAADLADEAMGAALSRLRESAERRPTLLLVDEVESLAVSTIRLLERTSTQIDAPPLRIVAAGRVSELRQPDLVRLVTNADLATTNAKVPLGPLDLEGVAAVVARATGEPDTPREQLQRYLHESEGSPLVLEALLTSAAGLGGENRAAVLIESVAARIEALSQEARNCCLALGILASASPALVAKVAALEGSPDRALRELAAAGLADEAGDRWRRTTRLADEFHRAERPAERFGALQRAAAALSALTDERDPVRLARIWGDLGESESAISCALEAATSFESGREYSEAADWVRVAICHLTRRDSRWARLRKRHADLLALADRHGEAARGYGAVSRFAATPTQRASLLSQQVDCLCRARRLEAAAVVIQRAWTLVEDESLPQERAFVQAMQGFVDLVSGRFESSRSTLVPAVDRLREQGDSERLTLALTVLSTACFRLRDLECARQTADESLAVARTTDRPRAVAEALIARIAAASRVRPVDEVTHMIAVARRYIEAARASRLIPSLLTTEIILLRQACRLADALAAVRYAEPRAVYWQGTRGFASTRIYRAELSTEAGRPAQAVELLHEVLAVRQQLEPYDVAIATGTLIEALLEIPETTDARLWEEIKPYLDLPSASLHIKLGFAVLDLERRVRPQCDEPFEPAWERFAALDLEQVRESEPENFLRARLTRVRWLSMQGRHEEAAREGELWSDEAEKRGQVILAVRGWGLTADAWAAAGQQESAGRALDRGRSGLDAAAGRVGDDDLRRDFLARTIFASIRKPPWQRKDAEKDRLMAIYRMIHALNSETDPDLVLESILDMALDVVQAERGMILLRDRAGEAFRVRVARNLEKETIADAAEFSKSVVRAAGAGKAVLSIDTQHDDRMRDFKSVSMYGIRSVICVPLRSRGKITGAVYLDSRSGGALFSENELQFLEAFADHAALALENAQIRNSLETTNQRLQVAAEERVRFGDIVGKSPAMQNVFDLVAKVTQAQVPVLIQGESGTGKELVARAIHFHGPRKRKPFLSENCAAIPETLLESELFGHVKGAFTGADRDRVGLFQHADGGTLFLDEVGDMPPPMQARLLRVLQEGEVRPVGGERTLNVDVRIVAATHRDLAAEVEAGRFREDLLYRLQVLLIELPPLRERIGDVPLLVEYMLEKIGKARGRPTPVMRSPVVDALERFHWPGNVRQLENTLQRIVVLAGDDPITLDLLEADKTLSKLLLVSRDAPQAMFSLEENEKEQIRAALRRTDGNRAKAARLLGISRATIFRKIKDFGLS